MRNERDVIMRNILVIPAFLLMSSVAMASEPAVEKFVPPEPTPCKMSKITKITKGPDGKEILTTETTADCGYDANQVKKTQKLQAKVNELQSETWHLRHRIGEVEKVTPKVEIPVDLPPSFVETKIAEVYIAVFLFFAMCFWRICKD